MYESCQLLKPFFVIGLGQQRCSAMRLTNSLIQIKRLKSRTGDA